LFTCSGRPELVRFAAQWFSPSCTSE